MTIDQQTALERQGALFGSPFPPSRPQAVSALRTFLFASFSFLDWRCFCDDRSADRSGAAAGAL